ncbi:hypothetical protein JOE49_002021 [Paenibacillus sp. PvR133]|nr:hypothetical protein [Paenibacillus sp. PvR133]
MSYKISLNNWQPLSTLLYDGWVAEHNKGIMEREYWGL